MRVARDDMARIDVGSDRRGEFFELRLAGGAGISLDVVEADRDDRSLLLLVREGGEKSKFLCGFDERHWFVAAIPETARGVTASRRQRMPCSRRRSVRRS